MLSPPILPFLCTTVNEQYALPCLLQAGNALHLIACHTPGRGLWCVGEWAIC